MSLRHTTRHKPINDLLAHRQKLIDGLALRSQSAEDLVDKNSTCQSSTTDLATLLSADSNIIANDKNLDTVAPSGAGLFSCEMEVEDVAGVVLDDEDGTSAAANGSDGLDDL